MRLFTSNRRHLLTAVHDTVMAGISFVLALYLRIGDLMDDRIDASLLFATTLCMLTCVTVFSRMRLYRGLWRYASTADMLAITQACTLALLLFYLVLFILTRLDGIPRSLPFIQWLLLLALLGAPRFFYRALRDRMHDTQAALDNTRVPVLLIGAGARAELFLRDTRSGSSAQYHVVGIVDSSHELVGRTIHNVRIYGTLDELPQIVEKVAHKGVKPQRAILTEDSLDGQQLRHLLEITESLGIPLARLPRLTDFKRGMREALHIEPIAIEDLLRRAQNVHDKEPVRALIAGKIVLVTGAGGTIGSELVRQIASFAPQHLIIFDSSEYALYTIDLELARLFPDVTRTPILGDVRNSIHIEAVFAAHQPKIVFHAAAIKHVPLAESNPEEAILTNVLGTKLVADACLRHHVATMVLISTDKAVNPTNVMGASKRLAENYCQALANTSSSSATRFVMVRFGNVLGSTGSVVPLFQQQLSRGGPLTVTHKDVVRYFMTVREAVELVLQTANLGASNGEICVLDMGQPVRIVDLAEQMIRLAGYTPYKDIAIEFTGLRPGEKMFEELFHSSEESSKTTHASIMLTHPRPTPMQELLPQLEQLLSRCSLREGINIRSLLQQLVPEFTPK